MNRPILDQKLRRTLALDLRDFSLPQGVDGRAGEAQVFNVEREALPVPSLGAILLEEIIGATVDRQPEEKVHWRVMFAFRGKLCSLELRKFGCRLLVCDDHAVRTADELISKLQSVIKKSEKFAFNEFASAQMSAGNVTVENRAASFRDMYTFFREKAEGALLAPSPERPGEDGFGLAGLLNDHFGRHREALYFGLGMLDSYFSWFEHAMVLLLPFAGYDPATDDLVAFIGDNWADKYDRILGFQDATSKRHYEELNEIKERLRNTYAHGGFEKRGGSLGIHLDGFSPVPATMTRVVHSASFRLFPIDGAKLAEVKATLDAFDGYLAQRYPAGMAFVDSGIPLVFSSKDVQDIVRRASDLDEFRAWLEGFGQYLDAQANGDF